jgi:hypothetical protein
MALPPDRLLSVLPNPYHALGPTGQPAGVVMFEPDPGGFSSASWRGYVGARIDEKNTVVRDVLALGDIRSARQDTAYTFDTHTPVAVPISPYYLERLREGSLLAADARTARIAGVKFVDPGEAIATARDAARERWKALTGEALPTPPTPAASEENEA